MKPGYVYILASRPRGALYTGVTSDLPKRIWEHQQDFVPGFTRKYGIKQLVYYERHDEVIAAIEREKHIKKWRRAWKVQLIEDFNPEWADLSREI